MRKSLPALACLSLVFISALLAFSCGPAEVITTGTLSGRITVDGAETGNIGFMVAISGTDYLAVTDDAGDFEITDIPAGSGYALYISPPEGSAVEPGLHESTFTVIAGQTTDAGTIDLEVGVQTVTMTFTNIPTQYSRAALRFISSIQVTNFAPETFEIYPEDVAVMNGIAMISYDIPLEKVANLNRREVALSLILFTSTAPTVPSTYVTWRATGLFLLNNTFSYNTSTEGGNFVLAAPGLARSDSFGFLGTPSWAGTIGIPYSYAETDGSYTAYMGYTQSAFDSLVISLASYGDDFLFYLWPYPDYITVRYVWNDIGTTLNYNTLTTLSMSSANIRTKEISLNLFDADSDIQNALAAEPSMTVRTGTVDTVVTPSTSAPLNIDATAWNALMASGFTVSITLGDTVYSWPAVFTSRRIYLSFLDATETPAP
jgi:hypothetical protein